MDGNGFLACIDGAAWQTFGSGSAGIITLGTATGSTNPQRSGAASTGLVSLTATSVGAVITGVEQMRVTSSGVGVGTTAPLQRLHVGSAAGTQTAAQFGDMMPLYVIHNYPHIAFNTYFDTSWKHGTTGYAGYVGHESPSGSIMFSTATSAAAGANAAITERMRITNAGFVGIGTSPVNRLDTYGNTGIIANLGSMTSCCGSGATLSLSENTSSNSRLPLLLFHDYGYSEGFLRLATDRVFEFGDNQSAALAVALLNPALSARSVLLHSTGNSYFNAGYVGIYSSTPGYRLEVVSADTGSYTAARFLANNLTQAVNVGWNGISGTYYLAYNAVGSGGFAHIWQVGGVDKMYLMSS